MYEHLLVPLDGSPAAERVLEHAEALARAFGSTVTLLRATLSAEMMLAQTAPGDVVGGAQIGATMDPTPLLTVDRQAAVDYLERVAARIRRHDVQVNLDYPAGPATTAILERAAALDVGLILMTTHGRSGLGRMVFGSVADSVLRHAKCPVLLVRVTDAQAAELEANADASLQTQAPPTP